MLVVGIGSLLEFGNIIQLVNWVPILYILQYCGDNRAERKIIKNFL